MHRRGEVSRWGLPGGNALAAIGSDGRGGGGEPHAERGGEDGGLADDGADRPARLDAASTLVSPVPPTVVMGRARRFGYRRGRHNDDRCVIALWIFIENVAVP
jgi:hypothetical protein